MSYFLSVYWRLTPLLQTRVQFVFSSFVPPLHHHSLTLKTTRSRVSPVRIGSVLHMINKSRLCRRKTFTDFRTQREYTANKLAKIMSLLVRSSSNKQNDRIVIDISLFCIVFVTIGFWWKYKI